MHCNNLGEWLWHKLIFIVQPLEKFWTSHVQSRQRAAAGQDFIYFIGALAGLCCCVWISRRSSWFITPSPSEPFPLSRLVTRVQTNQQRGQHLLHFSLLNRHFTPLKCTAAFTLPCSQLCLCFHSVLQQPSTIY